jgi:hypothetical protein
LKGETLYWKKFTRWTDDPSWRNHEHCEFCSATLSEDIEGDLHEGYTTEDEYNWICHNCYEEFKSIFQWKAIKENNEK